MPEHKADVHPKRRSQAMRMARGDTGKNYLNEFFDVIFYSVDSMLYEFGLFKDQDKSSLPSRKPLQGQEKAQPPSDHTRTHANPSGPVRRSRSLSGTPRSSSAASRQADRKMSARQTAEEDPRSSDSQP